MFMDEARFGRINRPVRCWAPPHIRPVVDCQIVREYTYAYGGVCPHDGVLDSLILPTMHSKCFELFAAEITKRHPDELIIMVCDGAGSHTANDLSLPANIRILTLPPYSPELNPAEQLWDLIRERRFANKAYDTLDDVENELADELHTLEQDHTTIQSLTNHPWITSPNLTAH
jgi:DDE superfamily endonuclease